MSPVSVSSVVERVARRLHRSVLLAAALWAAVAFSAVLLVAWLWAGPDGWTQGTVGPLLLDSVLLAMLVGSWPALRRIRRRWLAEPRVARCVEDAAGLRPGSVVGSLELSRELPRGVSRSLAKFAEQHVLKHLNHHEDHLAAPLRRRVLAWTRGGSAGLAVFAPALVLLAFLTPERSRSAWSALSTPVVLLSAPVMAPILVEPGDLEVRRGEGTDVSVQAPGRETATLHWQAAGDVLSSRALPLDGSANGSFHFDAIDVPVRYWATTVDGAESEVFELTPVDPLFVSDLRLVLEFPAHTAKPPEEYRGDVPPLSFPAGTTIKIDGRASRSLKDGSLTLREGGDATTLSVGGPTFTAVWVPRRSGVYEWRFNDERGAPAELLPQPIEVTLLGDAPPEVRFTFPAVDTLMPMTLKQPLVLEVMDDYGVANVDLVAYRVSADGEAGEPVTQRIEVGVPRALASPVLDMASWGLLPGDQVRYLARVTDNSPAAQTAETREWVLRMPEAAELRRGAEETLDQATKEMEELATQAARAAEEMRNLERQTAADRSTQGGRGNGSGDQQNAGFEQREDVRAALERQQGMSSKIDSLRSELNAMSQAMRDAGVSDPGLRQDLQEIQKALGEMSTPEAQQKLEQMQQDLGGMDARQAQEMLRQLSQSQEQLREAMEKAVDQLRRAAAEQDFRATTSEAEELARRERALEEAMREGGDSQLRAQQQAEVQRRTEQVQQNMQTLEQRLQQLGEEQAAKGVEESRQQAEAARQSMSQAQQQARQGQSQQASQQAQQAAAAMEQAASDLREAGREMADDRSQATRQALEGAAQDALGLARRQAEIREQMRDADANEMQQLRGDVGAVLQGLKSMTESVAKEMQQSGGGDPDVTDRAQQAAEALQRTIDAMSQRSSPSPSPSAAAENAVDALNRLALSALASARQQGEQSEGQQQGQQGDLSQKMEGAAQQQGQVNNQSGQIMPMQLGQQAMQRQLEQLAQQQREVAGELSDMAASPDAEKMLGDLKALEQEARQIAESLAGGRLDPETRRRQERLFHRLLDAGRTLEQDDELSEQREATTAGAVEARDVQPLSAEAVGAIRFRLPDAAILQQMGPAQRQLVIQYFERLNRGDAAARDGPRAGAEHPDSARRATGMTARGALAALASVGLVLVGVALPTGVEAQAGRAAGQRAQSGEAETRLLREASTLEARGDDAGAERVLRGLLEQLPTSSGALFALERALRAQGRTREVLPLLDRTLSLEPASSNLRSMKLRILVEIDSLQTLENEAQAWIRAEPGSPDPYRELARMYERAYGNARTVALLRDGRARLNDPSAFAVELGDLLERAGQPAEAAREWSLAIGNDGGQTPAIVRRVNQMTEAERAVVPLLLETLDRDPTTAARRVAAVRIALAVPLPDDALRLTRKAVAQLDLNARKALLDEVARRGEELDAHALSLWAYETLRDLATDATTVRALHARVAASALALGDTAKALDARDKLAQSLPRGSTERRRVVAETLRLQAPRSDSETLRRQLADFREEFPAAPELDELASALAYGLQAQGNGTAAAAVLSDVEGPRSALERAYLALDRGEIEDGVASLTKAVESLPPTDATEVIQLVSLLGRVGPGSASALGKAAVTAHRGGGAQAVEQLVAEVPRLPDVDRPALLAYAARMADLAGVQARGAELRRELIEKYKDSPERAEAALTLARWSARNGRTQEAVAVLEALIVDRPTSPLVPDARRELERIRGDAAGGLE